MNEPCDLARGNPYKTPCSSDITVEHYENGDPDTRVCGRHRADELMKKVEKQRNDLIERTTVGGEWDPAQIIIQRHRAARAEAEGTRLRVALRGAADQLHAARAYRFAHRSVDPDTCTEPPCSLLSSHARGIGDDYDPKDEKCPYCGAFHPRVGWSCDR